MPCFNTWLHGKVDPLAAQTFKDKVQAVRESKQILKHLPSLYDIDNSAY